MDIREDDVRVSGETNMKEVILELAREISLWSSFSLVAIREGRPEDLGKKDALHWYQGELEKNPNDKSLWYEMGTLLAKKGLCDEAVEASGRVAWLDPEGLKNRRYDQRQEMRKKKGDESRKREEVNVLLAELRRALGIIGETVPRSRNQKGEIEASCRR